MVIIFILCSRIGEIPDKVSKKCQGISVTLYQWRIQRGFSETKLFHFHGISKKMRLNQQREPPHRYTNEFKSLSRNPGSVPEPLCLRLTFKGVILGNFCHYILSLVTILRFSITIVSHVII